MEETKTSNKSFKAFLVYVIILCALYFSSLYESLIASLVLIPFWYVITPILGLLTFYKELGSPRKRPKKESQKKKSALDKSTDFILIFLIVMIVPRIWTRYFTGGSIPTNQEQLNERNRELSFAMNFFLTCIIAPLREEAIFRYLPSRFINNEFLYMFISSVIFAYVHCFTSPNPMMFMPIYIGVSIVLGQVYYKTERLFWSFCVHALFNFISGGLLTDFLQQIKAGG